jgi:serralysin
VRFDFSDAPVTVSLRDGVVAGEGADSVSGFEGVVATPFADRSTGNGVVNWLYGRGGNDKLYGLSGADRFYGGPGDDRMEGAGGNDDFFGGPGHDTCIQGRGHGIMKSC